MTLYDSCQRCGVVIALGHEAHFVEFQVLPVARRWTVCQGCGGQAVQVLNDFMSAQEVAVAAREANGSGPTLAECRDKFDATPPPGTPRPPLRWEEGKAAD